MNFNKQLGKVYGVESFVLGPKESKELYPLLNVDDLYGTLHSPGDGTIDPASWATTLSRAAMKNGGKVAQHFPPCIKYMRQRSVMNETDVFLCDCVSQLSLCMWQVLKSTRCKRV